MGRIKVSMGTYAALTLFALSRILFGEESDEVHGKPVKPPDLGTTVYIPGGEFLMGCPVFPESEGWEDLVASTGATRRKGRSCVRLWALSASPAHKEQVESFEMGKYEVTAMEFCEFLNAMNKGGEPVSEYLIIGTSEQAATIEQNPEGFAPKTGYEWAPAKNVTYMGAKRYCKWWGEKVGGNFRLPTEIEWEYAARGKDNRLYPWGSTFEDNHAFLAGTKGGPVAVAVGSFPVGATPEGIHDLVGNAPEWCGNYFYSYDNAGSRIDTSSREFAEATKPLYVNRTEAGYQNAGSGHLFHTYRGRMFISSGVHGQPWMRFPVTPDSTDPSLRLDVRRSFSGVGFRILKVIPQN